MAADGLEGDEIAQFALADSSQVREWKTRYRELREEHRALDAAIAALQEATGTDALQVARLKKQKLALIDQLSWLEDRLTPDIIA